MKTKSSLGIWTHTILAVFLLILWNGVLEARLVVYSEARLAAARLVKMENGRPDLRLTKDMFFLDGIEPLIYKDQQVGYLVKLKPQGFMILSDITELSPQVFVSFSGDFDTLRKHPFLTRILDHLQYDKAHLFYLDWSVYPGGYFRPDEDPDSIQIERNERSWSDLMSGSIPDTLRAVESPRADAVAPMLVSAWHLDAPYNNHTPRSGGQASSAGCCAIAMAQVMYFWKYPDRGQGSHSYVWNNRTLYADFNHPYYWDRMRSSYRHRYSNREADAVARLISDIGIAIDMNYGFDGSIARVNNNNAFVNFFKYSPDAHWIFRSEAASWTAWFNRIKQQMDIRRPAILATLGVHRSGSHHAIVVDGYRTSPSNQIHVNMGWGGYYDNYYTVSNIFGCGDPNLDAVLIDIHPIRLKTLNISANLGGTTKPAPGTYTYKNGSNVEVRALPAQDFVFTGWSGDASGKANPLTIHMDRDKSVTANFKAGETLRIAVSNASLGTTNPAPGTYTYENGSYVKVRAFPAPYGTFTGWSGDASGKANPVTIHMDREKSVRADFKLVNPPSNLTAVRLENRSLTQTEDVVELRWDPNPANNMITVVGYRVYQKIENSMVKLADLSAAERFYRHRMVPKAEQTYSVTSVSDDGGESLSVTITK